MKKIWILLVVICFVCGFSGCAPLPDAGEALATELLTFHEEYRQELRARFVERFHVALWLEENPELEPALNTALDEWLTRLIFTIGEGAVDPKEKTAEYEVTVSCLDIAAVISVFDERAESYVNGLILSKEDYTDADMFGHIFTLMQESLADPAMPSVQSKVVLNLRYDPETAAWRIENPAVLMQAIDL